MEKDYPKEYTRKYWKEIYKIAISELREELGIKGDKLKLAWNIVLISMLVALGIVLIGVSAINKLLGVAYQNGIQITQYVLLSLIGADIFGFFVINFIAIPMTAIFNRQFKVAAKRDFNSQTKIEELNEDYAGEKINSKITVKNINFPEDWVYGLPQYATILITNPNPILTISDVSLNCSEIMYINKDIKEIDQTWHYCNFQGKPNTKIKSNLTIKPGEKIEVYIADILKENGEGRLRLLLENNVMIKNDNYIVVSEENSITGDPRCTRKKLNLILYLEINGYIDNRQIKTIPYKVSVQFQTITEHTYLENNLHGAPVFADNQSWVITDER